MKQNLSRKEAIEWIKEADPYEPTDYAIVLFLRNIFDIDDDEAKWKPI